MTATQGAHDQDAHKQGAHEQGHGEARTENNGSKLRVALLFGGRSSEHGVSCVTAKGVIDAIDRSRFEVVPIGITPRGVMVLMEESDLADYSLTGEQLPEVHNTGKQVVWPTSVDSRELRIIDGDRLVSAGNIDVVIPMLHGPYGEDGTVQGMLELVDIPYVGSGVLGSALCMDKHTAKTVWREAGIAVAPWRTVKAHEVQNAPDIVSQLDEGLSYPLFVKPLRAGSSVGVSRVTDPAELPKALEVAFAEDHTVLIETGITGREVEIGVLQGRNGQAPRTSDVIGEIVFSGRDFYDFEAKYLGAAGADVVLPAKVTDAELQLLKDTAVKAFEVSGCAGYARVDFFLTDTGVIVNEINTLPGFTPISMFPKLWEHSGLGYTELISELIDLALETQR